MAVKKAPPSIYELKITLLGIEPPIWRRIGVSSSIRLGHLHRALQVVMGWTDSHLHQFEKDGKRWAVPEIGEVGLIDESRAQLSTVLTARGESMIYRYDFGDDWEHEVLLQEIVPVDVLVRNPVCLDGRRQCPPEDVGGVFAYAEFLEVIFNPKHKDYQQMMEWHGGSFHAEAFSVAAVNKALSRMRWPVR